MSCSALSKSSPFVRLSHRCDMCQNIIGTFGGFFVAASSSLLDAFRIRSTRVLFLVGKTALWYTCQAFNPATYLRSDSEEIFPAFEETAFLPAQMQNSSSIASVIGKRNKDIPACF
ncbi:hypothetical protein PGTUg99_007703 [Puccinia graminis f. sp. tritici]|uniref:Uncharacterized protein n=1 Tax=Puccinia graminis f. sp. tritici TaxID=56615 RepID=A0A5B0R028_PUCGR|nr:hypothetical protein PGTUg99_007703 [Puccinia graminis f. sp. tritici]